MKKQGFTLIELMVVIVIMGILAAVAVPKLFGQIAKSKASEVATNAAAYKTAQDAFAMTDNKVGTGTEIGYDTPKKGNFEYTASAAGVWTATSTVALNNCPISTPWTLTGTFASSKGKVSWVVSGDGATKDDCKDLTPGFNKLEDKVE